MSGHTTINALIDESSFFQTFQLSPQPPTVFISTLMPATVFRYDPSTRQADPSQLRPEWWDAACRCQVCPMTIERAQRAEQELNLLRTEVQEERRQREQLDLLAPEVIAQRNEKANEEARQEKIRVRLEMMQKELSDERETVVSLEAEKQKMQQENDELKLQLRPNTPYDEAATSLPRHLFLPLEGQVIGNFIYPYIDICCHLHQLSAIATLNSWRESELCKKFISIPKILH